MRERTLQFWVNLQRFLLMGAPKSAQIYRYGTHLKLRGQNIDPLLGSISFNPYRGQINHDLGHFLQHQNNPEKGRF